MRASALPVFSADAGRRAFARLAGLPPRAVRALRRGAGRRVRVELAVGPDALAVVLRPLGGDEGFYARTPHLALCCEGDRRLTKPEEEVLRRLAERLRGATLEVLGRLAEPEASASGGPDGGAGPDVSCVTDRWGGNPGQWRRFFAQKEFDRMYFWTNSSGFVGRVLYVVHGALECTFYPPDLTYRGMNFLNYPTLYPHDPAARGPQTMYEQLATDLQDADVVLGKCGRLEDFAEELAARRGTIDLVMVSWACLPTIIGDDEGRIIGAWRKAAGCPVLVNSIQFRMGRSFSLHEKLFDEVRAAPGFLEQPGDPGAVNLWGCPGGWLREELSPVLEELGARVNMRVLPDVDVRALPGYMRAAAQVVPERLRALETVTRLLAGLPLPTVWAPAPFGRAGTRGYARAAAEAAGRGAGFEAAWDRVEAAQQPRWEALRARAAGMRLAFVIDPDSAALLDGAGAQTVPVFALVEEMGFGIDLLAWAPDGEPGEAARRLAARPGVRSLSLFQDAEGLKSLLAGGTFRAVYTDIAHDHRVSEAGKAQFSMRLFEPGLAGAARTLERLLDAARLPFFERYARRLATVERDRDA